MSKKCWTRQSGGGKYVVCNDPPRGSRGQVGVYKADNPTGKQNPKLKERERKEKEKRRPQLACRVNRETGRPHHGAPCLGILNAP